MTVDDVSYELLEPIALPRGGLLVLTSQGPVQFGVPPETIKDTMVRPHGVPSLFVLTKDFFSYERGISFAEMEFPIYFNFFVAHSRVRVVGTAAQCDRLLRFMEESLFGPMKIDLGREIMGAREDTPWYPDLEAEADFFHRHPFEPERPMNLGDVIEVCHFSEDEPRVQIDGLTITRNADDSFTLIDPETSDEAVHVPGDLTLAPRTSAVEERRDLFNPPTFGVTVLGCAHGFDASGKTTGFILWVNGRGIMVDPPVDTTEWLRDHEMSPRCVDSIILTHCHSDHDAGTLQKALQADRIRLYTTETIYESFLRKSQAITGLERDLFGSILRFQPVPIGHPVPIHAARFVFNYALHSIPTIGFECWLGGKSLVYTSDTLNYPSKIEELRDLGVLSAGRAEALLDFPWHHDLIIHEAGVPPLHTPAEVLADLPDDVKRRLFLVHTTPDRMPRGKGLQLAPTGLEKTLVLDAESETHATAVQWLLVMRSVEHFRELSLDKAIQFIEVVETKRYEPGQYVIRQGDPGEHFYMILSGRCAIFKGEVAKKVFDKYDYFGEASLIMNVPRTADVVALTTLEVLAMKKYDFLDFIRGTGIEERMERLYANRGLNTWALMDKHPILSSLNATQRNELQSIMDLDHFSEGEVLLEEDAESCPAFLVASGTLEECKGGVPTARYEEGGLAAHITSDTTRGPTIAAPYTLLAASDAQVFTIQPEHFWKFLRSYPGLYLRLLHGQ